MFLAILSVFVGYWVYKVYKELRKKYGKNSK